MGRTRKVSSKLIHKKPDLVDYALLRALCKEVSLIKYPTVELVLCLYYGHTGVSLLGIKDLLQPGIKKELISHTSEV